MWWNGEKWWMFWYVVLTFSHCANLFFFLVCVNIATETVIRSRFLIYIRMYLKLKIVTLHIPQFGTKFANNVIAARIPTKKSSDNAAVLGWCIKGPFTFFHQNAHFWRSGSKILRGFNNVETLICVGPFQMLINTALKYWFYYLNSSRRRFPGVSFFKSLNGCNLTSVYHYIVETKDSKKIWLRQTCTGIHTAPHLKKRFNIP